MNAQTSAPLAQAARPVRWLLPASLLWVCVAAAAALWLATQVPWLRLAAQVDAVASGPNGSGGPVALVGINGVTVGPGDLIEEPDFHPTFAEWAAFYERQAALAAELARPQVVLAFKAAGVPEAVPVTVVPGASRPLADLPLVFWFQLLVGAIAVVSGAWVASVRPQLAAAWCLALTGLGLSLATFSAAVYSTRELALAPGLFHTLSGINHIGAMTFGVGLVGIFWVFPQPLGRMRWVWAMAGVFALWAALDVSWRVPDADYGTRLAVLVQMLLAVALGVVQWRRARGRADDRAAIRWVLLTFLVGSGGFIALVIVSAFLRWLPPLSQGWSFGLFLSVYVGLALGVFRYQLFELDRWSLRLLVWAFGLLSVVALDATLITWLRWDGQASLATSLLVCAGAYFPVRQWLWARLVGRRQADLSSLLPDVLQVALAPPAERDERWRQLLGKAFQPELLQREAGAQAVLPLDADLQDNGMALRVASPAVAGAWLLRGRDQGRALFGRAEQALASQLVVLTRELVASRDAYEQGARAERLRIAGDLHDDLGARLLSLAHAARAQALQTSGSPAGAPTADTEFLSDMAREALADLRLVVKGMTARPGALSDLVADWRGEAAGRLAAAGIALRFDDGEWSERVVVPPQVAAQLTRVMREAVSNVIKHSRATSCHIRVALQDGQLVVEVSDDGQGLTTPQLEGHDGYGLRNLAQRMDALGGQLYLVRGDGGQGTRLQVRAPLPVSGEHEGRGAGQVEA